MPDDFNVDGGIPVEQVSSDPTLTRKEFLRRVMGPVLLTGAALVGPVVVDKFVVPAQAAPPPASLKVTNPPSWDTTHHTGAG